jgi:serine protease DegQ
MLKRLWFLLAQVITVALGIFFVTKTLKPEWIDAKKPEITTTIVQSNTQTNKQNGALSYRNAATKAMPAVVNIFTHSKIERNLQRQQLDPLFEFFFNRRLAPEDNDNMPQEKQANSLGSGVIVTADGYILTNNHVVKNADSIEVALHDGRTVNAKLIGADPDTDLAVLKVNLNKLPFVALANDNSVEVGDVVLAVGNPFGVGQTITMGIISALKRNHLGINTFENFMQTDAAINPGNSGGALVDTSGTLIGINTAIFSKSGGNQGIGFAIPIQTAKQVMEQLIKSGEVTRGWIGIVPKNIDAQIMELLALKDKKGAFVAKVMEASPAQIAGLKVGDVIIRINDKEIIDTPTLLNTVAQIQPKTTAQFHIIRQQKNMLIDVNIQKRPNLQREKNRNEDALAE